MDEKLGRFHAKHAELKISGTMGVLIKAKNMGFVKALKPLLNELTQKDVWINKELVRIILEQVGEL